MSNPETTLPRTAGATAVPRPDWEAVSTVLLDMDGTLLDLHFDNYFWLERVPQRYAERHGLTLAESRQVLAPRFAAKLGSLEWYCTDFWSRELSLDIAAMKLEIRHRVRFLPGVETFLGRLNRLGLRCVVVTNAHPDSLRIKADRTGLERYFDELVSAHRFGLPKERADFWPRLREYLRFDPGSTLFVDDSLAVLRAAVAFGIPQVFAVTRPDTTQPIRDVGDFPGVERVAQLLE